MVCHGVGLYVSPEILHGIELRGIGWEEERTEVLRIATDEVTLDLIGSVGEKAVPEKDDRGVELANQVIQEVFDSQGVDVGIGVEAEVEPELIAFRGDA